LCRRSVPADVQASDKSAPLLSAVAPSESWFAANKNILAALLIVAVIIGVIVLAALTFPALTSLPWILFCEYLARDRLQFFSDFEPRS
jgi:hypothetical protein